MQDIQPSRAELAFAGILGAVGVAAAAASAHGGDARLWNAIAMVALTHAAAFIGLSVLASRGIRALRLTALVIAIGATIFICDLAVRAYSGDRLFAMAAPTGGVLMIAGWIGVALGALFRKKA